MVEKRVWHKHYPKEIPTSIEYDESTLHSYLKDSGKRYPKMKALHFMGKEMTYAEVLEEAKKMANYLQSLGLEKGDRVSIMLPNTPQAVVSYYGALMAGGIVVQTNPIYTHRELIYELKHSGAKFILCLDIMLPRVQKVQIETELKHISVKEMQHYLRLSKILN